MPPSERVQKEEALRAAALAGDEAAWRTLYDEAYAELWAYVVWRSAGLRDLAEEITQETWLIAVRRLGDFDSAQGRFVGWLRGIAAKVLHNHLRTRRRRPERTLNAVTEPAQDDADRRDHAELIVCALAELPERSEAVLRAKYLDLMSVAQIASEWNETPKAIESLLTRARQSFRAAYETLSGNEVAFKERKP